MKKLISNAVKNVRTWWITNHGLATKTCLDEGCGCTGLPGDITHQKK